MPISFHDRKETNRVSVKMLAIVDKIMALVMNREAAPNLKRKEARECPFS